VSVLVLDGEGSLIENCVYFAAGTAPKSRMESSVLYHTNSPVWGETYRLEVPIDKFYTSHIRLEFRHCPSKKPRVT